MLGILYITMVDSIPTWLIMVLSVGRHAAVVADEICCDNQEDHDHSSRETVSIITSLKFDRNSDHGGDIDSSLGAEHDDCDISSWQ